MISLYLLLALVLYDLSLHVFELLWAFGVTTIRHPLYVGDLFDKLGNNDPEKRKRVYQLFWTTYWSVATLLLFFYIVSRP